MGVSAFVSLPCAALAYLVKVTSAYLAERFPRVSVLCKHVAFIYLSLSEFDDRECSGDGHWPQGAGRQRISDLRDLTSGTAAV